MAKWPNKTVHSPFFVWRQTDGWREQELQPRLLSIIVDLFYRRSADFYCWVLSAAETDGRAKERDETFGFRFIRAKMNKSHCAAAAINNAEQGKAESDLNVDKQRERGKVLC